MILAYWIAEKLLFYFSSGTAVNMPSRILWKPIFLGAVEICPGEDNLVADTTVYNNVITQRRGWGEESACVGCWLPYTAITVCWKSSCAAGSFEGLHIAGDRSWSSCLHCKSVVLKLSLLQESGVVQMWALQALGCTFCRN